MSIAYYALVGAPNCGKTVLFNALTGARAKVANYPGVTVDKREGVFHGDANIHIIDLPGTYSLRVTSPDEAVTRDLLLGRLHHEGMDSPDAVIAVADATNLRMTLRMILELKTLGKPMVVSLNLSDVARHRGLRIDTQRLGQLLGVPVVETVAIRDSGTQALREAVAALPRTAPPADAAEMARRIDALDSASLYRQVEAILAEVVVEPMQLPAWHRRVDAVVMHPFWGMLILLLVLLLVFQAVYAWAAPLMDGIEAVIGQLGAWLASRLPEGPLQSLLVDGVIAGIGSVLVFLPQITILFAFILLLEDSGYLPRAAFLLDNLLARTGLSGRSFIPLLSSFACAVPAVMAARTIHDPRERLVTIAIAPMLTCSARLPVYALIIAAVVPDQSVWGVFNLQGLTLFALYLVGVLSAAAAAWVMKRLARRQGNVQQFPLLMELPTFRMPNFKHIVLSLWDRVSAFLKRAGTVIFAISVVLWALVSFPQAADGSPVIEHSYAGMIGRWIEPLFAPLGFNWEMCIAMVPGIAAREVVVAGLGTVYAVGGSEDALEHSLVPILHTQWGLPTALAFLVWYVYAPMCAATLAVIRRETKSLKRTVQIGGGLLLLAYVAAWLTYRISSWLLAG